MIDKEKLVDFLKKMREEILDPYVINPGYEKKHSLKSLDYLFGYIISGNFDLPPKKEKCRWKFDSEDGDVIYATACGNVHQFTEGNIKDNDHVYCTYCGNHIEEMKDE